MVTPILKCNSSNNPLIISTGIGDFEFSHSLGQNLPDGFAQQRVCNMCYCCRSATASDRYPHNPVRL